MLFLYVRVYNTPDLVCSSVCRELQYVQGL